MKVLLIGNIANNAYLLAKFLRTRGVEADVLCYNYYDIMGSPEWEESTLSGNWGENEHPNWYTLDLQGFRRPNWFVQGPLDLAIDYLIDRDGATLRKIERFNRLSKPSFFEQFFSFWRPSEWRFVWSESKLFFMCLFPLFMGRCFLQYLKQLWNRYFFYLDEVRLLDDFNFKGELNVFLRGKEKRIRELFGRYDIIQAHATDPLFPYVFNSHPYVAFEHGTLRYIPFCDDFIGNITCKSYRNADKVFITNADNLNAAKRLGLDNYTFLPHPINEVGLESMTFEGLRNDLSMELNSDYIVFHPARQHWDEYRHPDWEKGNDIFIRGFAKFVKEVNPKASAVFVDWGAKVAKSKELIQELSIDDRVKWVKPMPHRRMLDYIKACDIVADQFFLGAFGAITPKVLMCGKAVMLYMDKALHKMAFDTLPPVINTRESDEVFKGLEKHFTDGVFRESVEKDGLKWYNSHHSTKVITDKLIKTYTNMMNIAESKR